MISNSNIYLVNQLKTMYLMLCHFAALLLPFLARWRGRSFAVRWIRTRPEGALGVPALGSVSCRVLYVFPPEGSYFFDIEGSWQPRGAATWGPRQAFLIFWLSPATRSSQKSSRKKNCAVFLGSSDFFWPPEGSSISFQI